MNMISRIAIIIVMMIYTGGQSATGSTFDPSRFGSYTSNQFGNYWYANRAEISRFSLKQARYGEIHTGDAVLVFVTEKMNPTLQVKADNPDPDDITVMKLNSIRKFFTGIYPYSILTSVFSPVENKKPSQPLKISTSTQEWCGQVYMQMNLRENAYWVQSHSYFEKEADKAYRIPLALPEDALLNIIRIFPSTLPQGEFLLIPGTVYTRFMHQTLSPMKVFGNLLMEKDRSLEGNPLVRYEVNFPEVKRTLSILFETEFPYRIHSWEDTYAEPKWTGDKLLTSRAVRTHSLMIDYWRRHGNKDQPLLDKIGLKQKRN